MRDEHREVRLPSTLALSTCTVDLERRLVHAATGQQGLTTREAELLGYLAARPGEVISREDLLERVWGYSPLAVSRAADNAIHRLRAKIEADPDHPRHLITVHGSGYRFLLSAAEPDLTVVERAAEPARTRTLELGEVVVDLDLGRVTGPNGSDSLSGNEIALLETLWTLRAVDKVTLARHVWGTVDAGRLPSAVSRLRKKIELDSSAPRFLVTTPTGYALELPEAPAPEPASEPLFGRDGLLGSVSAALSPGRWVLLVGPGGIGKSRLAHELCLRRSGLRIDTAGVDTAEALAARVARAWGIPLRSDDPSERLVDVLARRTGLLVLDDLDDFVASGAESARVLSRWVQGAPGLRMLGTSRARTGLPGEVVIEVPPLEADAGEQLFVHCARASSSFRVRPDERAAIREIIERLDGMPLAIQLAAARSPVASPPELLARLGLDLLARPGEGRHSSLRAIVEASFAGLSEGDRALLGYLAVFRSFDLADAEAYAGPAALDAVQRLRSRSLIREVGHSPLRLACWQAVREVAEAMRASSADGGAATLRAWIEHLARFGRSEVLYRLDEALEPGLHRALDLALDELEAAVPAALRLGEPGLAARCAAALCQRGIGPYIRTFTLAQTALASDALSDADRATLLERSASLLFELRRFPEARAAAVAAARLAEIAGERHAQARALAMIGATGHFAGVSDLEGAEAGFEQARRVAASMGNLAMAGWIDVLLCEMRGDTEGVDLAARAHLATLPPEHTLAARALVKLGERARRDLRWSEARLRLEEAAHHPVVQRDRMLWLQVQQELVLLHLETGDGAALDAIVAASLPATRDCGTVLEEGIFLVYHAQSMLYRGDATGAARRIALARVVLERGPPEADTLAYLDTRQGEIALWSGEPQTSQHLLQRARAYFEARGNRPQSIAMVESGLGLAALALGRPDEALERCNAAVALLEPLPQRQQSIGAARLAMVLAARGERDRALAEAARSRALAVASGRGAPGTEVGHVLAELDRALASAGWTAAVPLRSFGG